jgi:DNA (cytosine-5)-methyltransferase 1
VRSDLERLGYAVGCLPIEAASAGADHFRDRYWFVANRVLADADIQRSQISVSEQGDVGTKRKAVARNHIRAVVDDSSNGWGEGWTEHEFRRRGFTAAIANIEDRQYLQCPDGKWRRLPPPSVRWMGTRVAARIHKLRAIGNAIDPRPATQFIAAYMETQT